MSFAKKRLQNFLESAGITIGGSGSDIFVHDERLYDKFATMSFLGLGTLCLGETYMDGWWDCNKLDKVCTRIFQEQLKFAHGNSPFHHLVGKITNQQSLKKAFDIGEAHYDIGNDLYSKMLDDRMAYTCGYWQNGAKNLNEAQEAKLDLVCRKLGLKPGMEVLDIGCGWGSFLKYAAEKYGAIGTGITVSNEQIALGSKLCYDLPVTLKFMDYRDLSGRYDCVVSLGMFEHVGPKNYRKFMEVVNSVLKTDGLFLLHTIGSNMPKYSVDPWVNRYIFPGGVIPSLSQIFKASEGIFIAEDLHNFGQDYDPTLMCWYRNFTEISGRYDERFRRMFEFYLLTCAATFRAGTNQLWQIVYSHGVYGGYKAIR
jgi:cyclopropane-fatty-acyl-phospholipid synthase